jgi:hypothetical protein
MGIGIHSAGDFAEERHRRHNLPRVDRRPHNGSQASAPLIELRRHRARDIEQPVPEEIIVEIRACLWLTVNAVPLGHHRLAETYQLRKDVPNPMTALASNLHLRECEVKTAVWIALRDLEARKIKHPAN